MFVSALGEVLWSKEPFPTKTETITVNITRNNNNNNRDLIDIVRRQSKNRCNNIKISCYVVMLCYVMLFSYGLGEISYSSRTYKRS